MGEFEENELRQRNAHPLYKKALLKEENTPDVLYEMSKSMWAVALEVPGSVHDDILDKWEAVLSHIKDLDNTIDGLDHDLRDDYLHE